MPIKNFPARVCSNSTPFAPGKRFVILILEMTWRGRAHVPGNAATIETIARAFPGEKIRVFAEAGHLAELGRILAHGFGERIGFFPAADPAYLQGKTHIASARRAAREFTTLRRALAGVAAGEKILLFLLSATSTAVFAASLIARLDRRVVGAHLGMHGNLNEITGWRSRNPLRRAFDLRAALAAKHPPSVRFLVLEEAIRRELARRLPAAGARADVLPLPVNLAELSAAPAPSFAPPWRFGLVGQATKAKGIAVFLDLAERMKARFGDRVAFYVIGMIRGDQQDPRFAALAHKPDHGGLTREAFTARLAAMHYILMPLAPEYYALSASGAVVDAITWGKPMIATPIPIIDDLFARWGDLGQLCAGVEEMAAAIAGVVETPDPARYAAQQETLRRVRESRAPARLAAGYAALVAEKFPAFPASALACVAPACVASGD